MTRNFTLLLLVLLLGACTKDEIPDPVSHLTDYQTGKTYVQTFYVSSIDNTGSMCRQMNSVDSRLAILPYFADFENYYRLTPSTEAIHAYKEVLRKEPYGPNEYELVADIRFTCTNAKPDSWLNPNLNNFAAVSRWRLVTVEKELYTFKQSEYYRYKIVKELRSFAPRSVPKNDNPALDNTITNFDYGQVYHQQFHLRYSGPIISDDSNNILQLSLYSNRIGILLNEKDNKADMAPLKLINQLKELCNQNTQSEPGNELFWELQYDPYTLAADFQFRYVGHTTVPSQYTKRTSDWKLVRETFDNADNWNRYWIDYEGKDPRNELIGSWECESNNSLNIGHIVFNGDGTCRYTRQNELTTVNCEYTFEMPDRLSIRNRVTGRPIIEFGSIRFNSTWDIFAHSGNWSGTFHRSK